MVHFSEVVHFLFLLKRGAVVSGIFDRAGNSTGGVKDQKGPWLACQRTGDSTGGRAHGSTAMLCVLA